MTDRRKDARHIQIYGIFLIAVFVSSPAIAIEPEKPPAIMKTGGLTSQPIGHYEFCQRSAADCRRISINPRPRALNVSRWNEIVTVNTQINALVRPVTDMELFGIEEHWTLPERDQFGMVGDCEDYVLAKQRELMALGWPSATLLPTVVRRENGEGHAVLTVRTNRGDYILDNLTDRVLAWNDSGYTFLKRVSAAHSGRWETIIDQRTLVGSILD